jgi:hypothetical protein
MPTKRAIARRFAIEWLWALGCWVIGFLWVLFVGHVLKVKWGDDSEIVACILFFPYLPVLLIRLTWWAVKTARSKSND